MLHSKWLSIGFLFSVVLTWIGCVSTQATVEITTQQPILEAASLGSPTKTSSPTIRSTRITTATSTQTPITIIQSTSTGTPTPRSILTPPSTLTPTATPIPTPANLPHPPTDWQWEFFAAHIPVTHYITHEIRAGDYDGETERPYGLDDQPMNDLGLLPRSFLLETAYQGSGLLPSGDLLQYADTRTAGQPGLVPFRYLVTPKSACDGYPLAGNRTCSIPFKTAATTSGADGPLIPVGSTIFVVELNAKIYVNDTAFSDGPPKLDLYTGYVDNYHYDRPKGASIWVLRPIIQ